MLDIAGTVCERPLVNLLANQVYGALPADDVTTGLGGGAESYVDGCVPVPAGPGLGVTSTPGRSTATRSCTGPPEASLLRRPGRTVCRARTPEAATDYCCVGYWWPGYC